MSDDTITFRRGMLGIVAVLVLVGLESVVVRVLEYGPGTGWSLPVTGLDAAHLAVAGVVIAGLWWTLSWEGVSVEEIGLSPTLAVPGAVAVAGFFLAFNAIAAALAVASGNAGDVGYHWTVSPAESLAWFFVMFVVAGVVEEVAFRGYLQTKLIAWLGGGRTVRVGAGILLASLLFAAYHLPRIAAGGTPAGMTPVTYLASLTVSGIGYGILYEWTQNLYVPIFVHTAGNAPGTAGILFVTTAGWPAWASAGYLLSYVGVVIAVLLLYRRWAFDVGRMPVWRERHDLGALAVFRADAR